MTLKRLLLLLTLVAAVCTLSLIGGRSLPSVFSVPAAFADACNYAGEWPNCATQCAVTGNNCDEPSDGDVDYAWICATTGNSCGGGGGCSDTSSLEGNPDTGAVYLEDSDGTYHWIPDVDTANEIGIDWNAIDWCGTPQSVGDAYPSVDASWYDADPWYGNTVGLFNVGIYRLEGPPPHDGDCGTPYTVREIENAAGTGVEQWECQPDGHWKYIGFRWYGGPTVPFPASRLTTFSLCKHTVTFSPLRITWKIC
jgi:hypothetical protein